MRHGVCHEDGTCTVVGPPESHYATILWSSSYLLHKARGCAVVTIEGKNHYLGRYGSPESREKYGRLIAEWSQRATANPIQPLPTADPAELSVNDLILRFLNHAEVYYRRDDGSPTGEIVASPKSTCASPGGCTSGRKTSWPDCFHSLTASLTIVSPPS